MREINYLQNHKDYFKLHICGCYPFSTGFMERNIENLNWNYLSSNEKLSWSALLIEKFQLFWNWDCLSGNESLPWSDEMIIQFADKWKWNFNESHYESCLLNNDSIKWSKNIIYKYPGKYPVDRLAQNTELLNKHPEMLEDFKEILWWDYISGNEYMNWSEELIDRFIQYWNWEVLSANEAIKWTKELKGKYKDHFNPKYCQSGYPEMWINKRSPFSSKISEDKKEHVKVLYTTDEFEIRRKLYPIGSLSLDDRVPWSEELIAKYENEWDWEYLSMNENLPWSEKLIDKYIDKLDFGGEKELYDGTKHHTSGLSYNAGLPWSLDLIRKYESKWDWCTLTYSDYIPWSLDIIEEFDQRWDWDQIIWNEAIWNKVFYPFLDDQIIESLLIT